MGLNYGLSWALDRQQTDNLCCKECRGGGKPLLLASKILRVLHIGSVIVETMTTIVIIVMFIIVIFISENGIVVEMTNALACGGGLEGGPDSKQLCLSPSAGQFT